MPSVDDLLGPPPKPKVADLLGSAPQQAKPKVEDLLGKPEEKEGFFSRSLKQIERPIKEIIPDIKQEFQAGGEALKGAFGQAEEKVKQGKSVGLGDDLKMISGGAQQAFSPVTGAVKALAGDPLRRALGAQPTKPEEGLTLNRAKNLVADTAELGLSSTLR